MTARPDQHGEYRVRNLPAGEYLAIAIAALETGRERDPSLLQQFVPFATRLTVGNGGRMEVTLELRQ